MKQTQLPFTVVSASISKRLGSFLIDYAVIGAIFFGIYSRLGLVPLNLSGFDASLKMWPTFIFLWIYFAVMESTRYQATIGKLVLRLRVCDYSFERISFLRAFFRYLARAVLGASLFVMMWSKNMQGLHDLLTKTLVLDAGDVNIHKRNLLRAMEQREQPIRVMKRVPTIGSRVPSTKCRAP